MLFDARAETAAKTIHTTLRGISSPVEEVGWGHWRFPVSNGKQVAATARLADDWLLLDLPLSSGKHALRPWSLLAANARLSGFAKFALDRQDGQPKLLAEIPITDDRDLTPQLPAACAELERGLSLFAELKGASGCGGKEVAGSARGRVAAACAEADPATEGSDLLELCEEAGWPGRSSEAGTVVVDLEAGSGFWQAHLEPAADASEAAMRASVRLALREEVSDEALAALGIFLLEVSGVARWARASVDGPGNGVAPRGGEGPGDAAGLEDGDGMGRPVPCFEVSFAAPPTSGELHRAFSALSVACRFFGREARLIQTEAVSSRYMELRHPTRR